MIVKLGTRIKRFVGVPKLEDATCSVMASREANHAASTSAAIVMYDGRPMEITSSALKA
jgi:hypothetical protein